MYFLIEDDDLLKNYITIWDKASADVKKEFEPVFKTNFLKKKIKSYGDDGTDFIVKEIRKMDFNLICLSVINLYSALNKYRNQYL